MRMILYDDGDEYDVQFTARGDDKDETYVVINRLCGWLIDAADLNSDRGFDLTADRIRRLYNQMTSALTARGFYDKFRND